MRQCVIDRKTKETNISLSLCLDGDGTYKGSCNIGFLDHMFDAFCVHANVSMELQMQGDLEVDCHHSVEDLGIVLGMALKNVLEEKAGLKRYGSFYIPMDEALAFCSLDVSGRPFLVFNATFENEKVGTLDCCMVKEFFRAVCIHSGLTCHINVLYGENDHHKIEAIFKAFAHALKEAVTIEEHGVILSSKGMLE